MNFLLYLGSCILTFFWSCFTFTEFWQGEPIKSKDNTPLIIWFLNLLAWESITIWTLWRFVN